MNQNSSGLCTDNRCNNGFARATTSFKSSQSVAQGICQEHINSYLEKFSRIPSIRDHQYNETIRLFQEACVFDVAVTGQADVSILCLIARSIDIKSSESLIRNECIYRLRDQFLFLYRDKNVIKLRMRICSLVGSDQCIADADDYGADKRRLGYQVNCESVSIRNSKSKCQLPSSKYRIKKEN